MKKIIALLIALMVLGLASVAAAGPCQDACYQEKSQAYQKCRAIPPSDRAARVACFKRADGALKRCLAQCK